MLTIVYMQIVISVLYCFISICVSLVFKILGSVASSKALTLWSTAIRCDAVCVCFGLRCSASRSRIAASLAATGHIRGSGNRWWLPGRNVPAGLRPARSVAAVSFHVARRRSWPSESAAYTAGRRKPICGFFAGSPKRSTNTDRWWLRRPWRER